MSNVVHEALDCESNFYQLVLTVTTVICASCLTPIYVNIVQLSQCVQYLCRQSSLQTAIKCVNSIFSFFSIRM